MIEREAKLEAPAGFRALDVAASLGEDIELVAEPDRRFQTVYWDTADLRLVRWGCSLRFRSDEGWMVKLPAGGTGPRAGKPVPASAGAKKSGARAVGRASAGAKAGAVLARDELQFGGSAAQPPAAAVDLLQAYARGAELAPVVRMRTLRRVATLQDVDGSPIAELDDDEVSILDGRRIAARFREIEVEARNGASGSVLRDVVARLVAAGARRAEPTPKLVRALGARAGEPEVSVDPLHRDAAAGDAVRRAIAASVQRLMRHDPGVRLGLDPEEVHQARVATRRLRSDLRTFSSLLDVEWAIALRDELAWLAGELGRVRDGEVLLARLRATASRASGVDAPAIAAVLDELDKDVAQERRRLLDGMREPRYVALLDDLVEAAHRPVLSAEAERPAAEVLPRLVLQPWRKLERARDHLSAPPADGELHRLRILAKRARYAAEAVAPVLGKPAAAFAEAVAALQEVLGEFHDAVVAAEWLAARAGSEPTRAFAVGALYALELQAAAQERKLWPAAWKKLDRRSLRAWM